MKNKRYNEIIYILIFVILSLFTTFIYPLNTPRRLSAVVVLLTIMTLVCGALIAKRTKPIKGFLFSAFLTSFFIKADYIIYTPTWIRQHDVIGFGADEGQAALIEFFYDKMRLIDFDPRTKWGFFQPPLHHMIAGLWLRMQVIIGRLFSWSYDHACENIQILTLIYSLLIIYFAYKIMKRIGLNDRVTAIALLMVALHPSFIFMSGSINNDILCILLQIVCIYFFTGWMQEVKNADMLLAALFMGLSMMAKLSAVLLVPALGIALLYRLFAAVKRKEKLKKLLLQYAAFGLISVPIGIWSPVRNLVKFGVPLSYTPKVGEGIENVSILERIFYPGSERTPFICLVGNGHAYDEFNVPLALLKTSLFGEADFSVTSPVSALCGWALLMLGAAIALITIVSMFLSVFRAIKEIKNTRSVSIGNEITLLAFIYIMTSIAFIVRLCFTIPNFSSQDFRYIAHIIIPCAAFYAMETDRLYQAGKKKLAAVSCIIAVLFVAASYFMYLLAGCILW